MTIQLNLLSGTVKADLTALVDEMGEEALRFLDEQADVMVQMAKSLCPVDTGSLQRSIRKERTGKTIRVRAGGHVTNPKTGKIVDYAVIIEHRTPFMQPAWTFIQQGIVEGLRSRVEQRVNTR